MTLAASEIDYASVQHLTLSNVTWEFYEHVLASIGNGQTRVTFLDGEIEIMSPLPKHERWGARIARLIEMMALERETAIESLGSTTFRTKAKQAGLEPDECFYIRHADAAGKIEAAWDASVDPPPDLAVEIDITHRSIERQPIYAALKVQELWRFDGRNLNVLLLDATGAYQPSERSVIFPYLPMDKFTEFLQRLAAGPQLTVLKEFRAWVRTL